MSFIEIKEGRYVSVDSPSGKKAVKEAAAKAKVELIAKTKAAAELAAKLKRERIAELEELLKEAKK